MKRLWTRTNARAFGRILFKVFLKTKSIPDSRKLCRVEQELPFSVLCILMAMLTGNKSQEEKQSWISANYNELCNLYFAFYETLPISIGPISQSSISRILAIIPPPYLNDIVAKLGQVDFQKAWVEYSKYRIEMINSTQIKSSLFGLMQNLKQQSIRVLAVDGKARKGVIGGNDKTEIDITVHDVFSGQTLHRITIPEKKGEATVFADFVGSEEFKKIVKLFQESHVVVTADAGITSRYLTCLLIEAGASYNLAIKGNAGNVLKAFESMKWELSSTFKTNDDAHGRNEERIVQVLNLKDLETSGLYGDIIPNDPSGQLYEYRDSIFIAKVTSSVVRKDSKNRFKTELNHRYFILGGNAFRSLENESVIAAGVIRSHWKIESNHWIKDVVLCEDNCPTKTPNSSQILASLRDISLGLMRLFSKSPTQFIRELKNNIKDLWTEIGLGVAEEKANCYG